MSNSTKSPAFGTTPGAETGFGRQFTRRDLLGSSAVLGATAALAGLLPSAKARAATPKKGGHMKLASAHGATTDTLNPGLLPNGYQWMVQFAIANTLTETLADGSLGPSLATEWSANADASVWTFELRKGVEFHNGKTMEAQDVIDSFNHHRAEDLASFVKPLVDQITDIKTDGKHRVIFHLSGGNADFPVTTTSAGFTIFPSDGNGHINWQDGNGTGGYKLKRYDPGVVAELERNPNYWNPDRAHADQITMLVIADPSARVNALMTGVVHAIDSVELKVLDRLAKTPGINVEETSGSLHYTFPMLTKTAPFDDVHVRQALKHAINREEMLSKILQGHGSIGNDNPIGPSYRYFADDIDRLPYDPDKARWHLKQAGHDSIAVKLSAADAAFSGAVDAAVLYKEHARPAGIDIQVVREPNDGYWSNVWLKKPWCACYWGGYTTESEMFLTGYAPGAAWNDTQWDDEEFNKLMAAGRTETNPEIRREIYRDMQIILRDRGGAVVPCFANDVLARSDAVQHDELAADGAMDGRRIAERWWVA
ncbi:peptide ABC transporter substrate-binding protein [Hwanghaeella grinnelliae]|uniref:Peptide ABC transporter substrate-binding protein n=1 Tax=Hwanghaeella grinnelliae TaxID=2500179 RepID=A0A3S3URG4_9PROT|nr:ABC transporter substrate-binding protein [Hwanghaeella grinnelliae]RVU38874.1 peptide ABC transporter substrate-binding protein [Hwanghaeella grinnelliae]